MGVFEHFPYVNYHELNLSWILRKLKELEDVIGSQIVDLVARAGVAENAQAIADLTDTVEENATTAHNEAAAAQSAASAAQSTANSAARTASGAQQTADAINSSLAVSTLTGSNAFTPDNPSAVISEFALCKSGNMVTAFITIGSVTISAGENFMGTIPAGYRPRVSVSAHGSDGAGSAIGQDIRVAIFRDGTLYVYASESSSSTIRMTVTYMV